ncbi:hypothetical protein FRX31_014875 [Thalictrum thalictroides]|uniref:Uncharacterized protein n=1 Tax=Thalictrum thalictroides TaxID=46969 RepID=A0A7J6WDT3_THATH|nr:hypothetical protein FRX31_014875 [Thalictrum thalictroides]
MDRESPSPVAPPSLATFIPVNLTSGRAFFASISQSKKNPLLELEEYAMLEWLVEGSNYSEGEPASSLAGEREENNDRRKAGHKGFTSNGDGTDRGRGGWEGF